MLEQLFTPVDLEKDGIIEPALLAGDDTVVSEVGADYLKRLVEERSVFLCRLNRGQPTLVTRHLLYCMTALCCEPTLSPQAQEVLDWIYENQGASFENIRAASDMEQSEFLHAFAELQRSLCIAPIKIYGGVGWAEDMLAEEAMANYLWGTTDYWCAGLQRPAKYADIGYCLEEVRRLLSPHFSAREINQMVYRCA